ncbi:hypothetical protein BLOT_001165 [Blomia tropicalis]|nr:hypothetical protein BLOT_001165 [Blomia tropicalis]
MESESSILSVGLVRRSLKVYLIHLLVTLEQGGLGKRKMTGCMIRSYNDDRSFITNHVPLVVPQIFYDVHEPMIALENGQYYYKS